RSPKPPKIKVNKGQILLDVRFTVAHKVCDPHMTTVVDVKPRAALETFQRPVLAILNIEIAKDDGIQFKFAQLQKGRDLFQPDVVQCVNLSIASQEMGHEFLRKRLDSGKP